MLNTERKTLLLKAITASVVTGIVVMFVLVIMHKCDPWDSHQQALEWTKKLGLTGVMIDCYNHNDDCHAECSIAHDSNNGTAREVISITCANNSLGNSKGKCWKVTKR
jgi:hypothetical protein